jgi:hypothetical protein
MSDHGKETILLICGEGDRRGGAHDHQVARVRRALGRETLSA